VGKIYVDELPLTRRFDVTLPQFPFEGIIGDDELFLCGIRDLSNSELEKSLRNILERERVPDVKLTIFRVEAPYGAKGDQAYVQPATREAAIALRRALHMQDALRTKESILAWWSEAARCGKKADRLYHTVLDRVCGERGDSVKRLFDEFRGRGVISLGLGGTGVPSGARLQDERFEDRRDFRLHLAVVAESHAVLQDVMKPAAQGFARLVDRALEGVAGELFSKQRREPPRGFPPPPFPHVPHHFPPPPGRFPALPMAPFEPPRVPPGPHPGIRAPRNQQSLLLLKRKPKNGSKEDFRLEANQLCGRGLSWVQAKDDPASAEWRIFPLRYGYNSEVFVLLLHRENGSCRVCGIDEETPFSEWQILFEHAPGRWSPTVRFRTFVLEDIAYVLAVDRSAGFIEVFKVASPMAEWEDVNRLSLDAPISPASPVTLGRKCSLQMVYLDEKPCVLCLDGSQSGAGRGVTLCRIDSPSEPWVVLASSPAPFAAQCRVLPLYCRRLDNDDLETFLFTVHKTDGTYCVTHINPDGVFMEVASGKGLASDTRLSAVYIPLQCEPLLITGSAKEGELCLNKLRLVKAFFGKVNGAAVPAEPPVTMMYTKAMAGPAPVDLTMNLPTSRHRWRTEKPEDDPPFPRELVHQYLGPAMGGMPPHHMPPALPIMAHPMEYPHPVPFHPHPHMHPPRIDGRPPVYPPGPPGAYPINGRPAPAPPPPRPDYPQRYSPRRRSESRSRRRR